MTMIASSASSQDRGPGPGDAGAGASIPTDAQAPVDSTLAPAVETDAYDPVDSTPALAAVSWDAIGGAPKPATPPESDKGPAGPNGTGAGMSWGGKPTADSDAWLGN